MNFTILQSKLKEGLNLTSKITGKSFTLPILSNVLLSIEKNLLRLSSTDLEIGINWWSLVKTETEEQIVVPVNTFLNFINFLPDKKINLYTEKSFLNIKCDSYNTKLKIFPSDDFPIIPKVKKDSFIKINCKDFTQGLKQVVDFTSFNSSRPEISGVYLDFQNNNLTIVATDSFRLGEKKINTESSLKKNVSFIIPQKTIKEVINILSEKKGNLKVYFNDNQIMFESQFQEIDHPEVQLTSRLIEGEYPQYKDIIPKQNQTEVILAKNEFLNQIKSASLFSNKINEIGLKVDSSKNKLEIYSQNPDIGEYKSSMGAKIKGKTLGISFNYKFLVDGLLNIKSSELLLELNSGNQPSLLRPVGDNSYIYLIMPIKTT